MKPTITAAHDISSDNQASTLQPMQNQRTEFRLFYQPPNDDNFYHVTCKMISQNYLQKSASLDDDYYDFEFFFQGHHATCKLLSHSLIVNILNKEFYGIDFDVNDLKRKYLLTPYQKLNLELSLKQIIPCHLSQLSNEMSLNSNENLNYSRGNIENNITATMQDLQNHLSTHVLQLNELGLFYHAENDNNIYYVSCKMILQDYFQESENSVSSVSWNDYDYHYDFFFQRSHDSTTTFHVTCKLLSHLSIINMLNKKIYGLDLGVNDLGQGYLLTLYQKLSLKQNLERILSLYLSQQFIRSR